MAFVSVTRIKPRGWRAFVIVTIDSFRIRKQLRGVPGFCGGYLASGPGFAMWTVSVWDDEASMRAFRNKGAHAKAMPKLFEICSESSVVHWTADDVAIPPPDEAAGRMKDGRTTKLRHPTAAQIAGDPWPDRIVPSHGLHLNP